MFLPVTGQPVCEHVTLHQTPASVGDAPEGTWRPKGHRQRGIWGCVERRPGSRFILISTLERVGQVSQTRLCVRHTSYNVARYKSLTQRRYSKKNYKAGRGRGPWENTPPPSWNSFQNKSYLNLAVFKFHLKPGVHSHFETDWQRYIAMQTNAHTNTLVHTLCVLKYWSFTCKRNAIILLIANDCI